MIAKLIVHDVDRERARRRMLRALAEFRIEGVPTLLGFHQALLEHPCFIEGATCHGIVESELLAQRAEQFSHLTTSVSRSSDGATLERATTVEVDGRRFDVRLRVAEPPHAELARRRRERLASAAVAVGGRDAVVSPMQGTVLTVNVSDGQLVAAGDVLCIVEAMKMENEVTAHLAGRVTRLSVAPGEPVTTGQVICVVDQVVDGAEQ
jgi:acetyl-CoA/propionyl-CoA carboxylase biotin carboxyl carrier protein